MSDQQGSQGGIDQKVFEEPRLKSAAEITEDFFAGAKHFGLTKEEAERLLHAAWGMPAAKACDILHRHNRWRRDLGTDATPLPSAQEIGQAIDVAIQALTQQRARIPGGWQWVPKELVDSAEGLAMGDDWNKGTQASIHRPRLIAALRKLAVAPLPTQQVRIPDGAHETIRRAINFILDGGHTVIAREVMADELRDMLSAAPQPPASAQEGDVRTMAVHAVKEIQEELLARYRAARSAYFEGASDAADRILTAVEAALRKDNRT